MTDASNTTPTNVSATPGGIIPTNADAVSVGEQEELRQEEAEHANQSEVTDKDDPSYVEADDDSTPVERDVE